MSLRITLVCLAVGAATEVLSSWQRLWVYHPPWLRAAGVLVVYGLIFGWMSTALAVYPALWRFAAGAAFGVAYEAANLAVFRFWSFPQKRLLFLRGPVALALGAGIPWGLLPLVAPLAR
jgi:hypothetical protein